MPVAKADAAAPRCWRACKGACAQTVVLTRERLLMARPVMSAAGSMDDQSKMCLHLPVRKSNATAMTGGCGMLTSRREAWDDRPGPGRYLMPAGDICACNSRRCMRRGRARIANSRWNQHSSTLPSLAHRARRRVLRPGGRDPELPPPRKLCAWTVLWRLLPATACSEPGCVNSASPKRADASAPARHGLVSIHDACLPCADAGARTGWRGMM